MRVSFATLGMCALLAASAGVAQASVVTYANLANWNGAVSGVSTYSFPDPGAGNSGIGYDYYEPATVTFGGVIFSTVSDPNPEVGTVNLYLIGSIYSLEPVPVLSSQASSPPYTQDVNLLITFPTQQTAFAVNFGSFEAGSVTFTLSNGHSVTGNTTGAGYAVPDFMGLTDDSPFTSVFMTTSLDFLHIGPSFAQAFTPAAVPEPGSLTLLCLAGGAAGYRWWRRKPSVQAA